MKLIYKLLIAAALILPLLALLRPGYLSQADLQVIFLNQMQQCMEDGQIPCRWVPDMGAGFGLPFFNYNASLAYYLGMLFVSFGIGYINTLIILFAAATILAFYFMYILLHEFFGEAGAIIAGIIFVYIQHFAIQLFFGDSLGMAWATVLLPLILWSLYKFVKKNKLKYFVISIATISATILTHNIFALFYISLSIIWVGMWLVKYKNINTMAWTLVIYLWALSLSAFFIVPALFEKNLVKNVTRVQGALTEQPSIDLDEYWPNAVEKLPQTPSDKRPVVVLGNATISPLSVRSSRWQFDAEVHGTSNATMIVPIHDFTKWEVVDNGVLTPHTTNTNDGLITIELPPGKHIVVGWFKNTKVRELANLISFCAFVGLMIIVSLKKWNKRLH